MSYRRPGFQRRLTGGSATASRIARQRNNYARPQQTAGIRHEATFDSPDIGITTMLPLGEYFLVEHSRFIRTSDSGTPDLPITPTVSNNIAGSRVMNGSTIYDYSSNIRLKNQDSVDNVTLDVFNIALSFYDSNTWNSITPDSCPVNFDLGVNTEGQTTSKVTLPTDLSMQTWNNFKFQQHYMSHLGTITIGDIQGDNVVELKQTRIPGKCRRSQTGMYWATLFLYDATKNSDNNANIEFNHEQSFKEVPSAERIVNFPE